MRGVGETIAGGSVDTEKGGGNLVDEGPLMPNKVPGHMMRGPVKGSLNPVPGVCSEFHGKLFT